MACIGQRGTRYHERGTRTLSGLPLEERGTRYLEESLDMTAEITWSML